MIGARAARHSGVRDDDIGYAGARNEIAPCIGERRRVANVAGINDGARGTKCCGDSRKLGLAPREQSNRSLMPGVMTRKRLADSR